MSRAKKFFAAAAKEAKAIEDAKPKSWEKRPWTSLDALLVLALAEKFHPGKSLSEMMSGKPKKFLKIAFGLVDKVSESVWHTTVLPVYKSALPFQTLGERVGTYLALEGAQTQFVADGYHGMLIHNSVIYPVRVIVENDEAHDWAFANEPTLRHMAAEVGMRMLGVEDISCHVMLFSQWGFSNQMALVKRDFSQPIKTATASVNVLG